MRPMGDPKNDPKSDLQLARLARQAAQAQAGGKSGQAARGYESRGDGVFHPNAAELCDNCVTTFKATLETKAVKLAKKEKTDDVQADHVRRVNAIIGPSSHYRRRARELSKFVLGIAATTAVSLALGRIVTVSENTATIALVVCIVIAILAAPFALRDLVDP